MVHIQNNDYDNNLRSTPTQDIKVGADEDAQKYGSFTAMAITIIIISARQDDYRMIKLLPEVIMMMGMDLLTKVLPMTTFYDSHSWRWW